MNSKELKHFGMGGLSLVPMDSPASSLFHHGVKGMKWGVRRYQNEDGTRIKGSSGISEEPRNQKVDRARRREIVGALKKYNGGSTKKITKHGNKFVTSDERTKVLLDFYDQYNSKTQAKMDELDMDVEELRGAAQTKAIADRDRFRKEVYTKWYADTKATYNRKMASALLSAAGVSNISDADVDYVREKFKTDTF